MQHETCGSDVERYNVCVVVRNEDCRGTRDLQ